VRKSGFERFVAMASDKWSFLYGMAAMGLAVAMGWGAGLLGRRI
jgi:hypothetical protein